MAVWAVIAAAGRGERLGLDRPKVFAKLGGRPMLAESLERFDASDWVDSIVVAAPPDWEEPVILLGVVPTLPIPDTVKRVDGDQVAETVDREQLVVAQTPQAFIWPVLRDAVASGGAATDCASLVEAHGGRIKAVEGDPRLVKITDRSDLELVERWL